MKILLFLIHVVVALMGFSFTSVAHAQRIGQYDENWQIIKTPHFDVIVNAKQLDLGRYYAVAAERAYANLSTVFDQLAPKVVLIVNDTTDVSNGYATRIPYAHIMAYSVLSSDHDSLSEAGDWGEILITHELTHIMQFEPANGFYKILKPIFGNIVAPDMLMPTWWKEGMAVEVETQFSKAGRTASNFQDTTYRSLVLEKKLNQYDLPQANETLPSWPYGSRPYVFGSIFFSQLVADTQNIKSLSYLASRQGERIPYFIQAPMNEISGLNYESGYNKALYSVEQNALQEIKQLNTVKTSDFEILDEKALSHLRPTYSPSTQLLAYEEIVKEDAEVKITDLNGKKIEFEHLPKGSLQSLQFHPTDKKLLYTKLDLINSKYKTADLYEYDLMTQKSVQLTHGARARNAVYSADGNSILFITTENGQTQIRTMDLKTKQIQFVINSGLGNRYESVAFENENEVLATKFDPNGKSQLYRINVQTKVENLVNLNLKQIRFIKKVNGSYYFISADNGVNNVYVSRDLKSAQALTHVLSGIWSFDISPDEKTIWGSLLTGSGFKIAKITPQPDLKKLPAITNKIAERYHPKNDNFVPQVYNYEDYSAGSYLWPSYWIPYISTSSSSKGVYLQAQTSGHDPISVHAYNIVASYDSELQRGNFNGSYINSTQSIPFKLASGLRSFALGSYSNIVETTTNSLSLLPDMFVFNKDLALEVGGEVQNVDYTSKTQHAGPYAELAYINYSQSLFDISPLSGWGGDLKLEHLFKTQDETGVVAKDYDKAQMSLVNFFSKWLPEGHAIKTRVSGQVTFQNVLARYGANSSTQFFEQDGVLPQYVLRGYSAAQFFGRNIWNANLEYRFPVSNIERGSGSDAYFFRRITGAFVTDGIGVDGFGLAEDLTLQPLKANESIWSSGLELKLESTIGYILPMNFVLGYYLPYSPQFASSSQIGLSLQIGGL
ncbi:MAG: TolB family protein [Pseudobdellovibrio sp.]